MKNNVQRPHTKMKLYKYNYLRSLIYKSIFVVVFLVILLILKKGNFKVTNDLMESIKRNMNYDFHLVEDSKKVYKKAQIVLDGTLEAIGVFKPNTVRYAAPIAGTVFKSYGENIMVNNEKVKNIGLDLKSTDESDPKAVLSGVVSSVKLNGNKGYFVTIENEGVEMTYGYLSKSYVSEGSRVEVGDFIGLLGTNKDGNKYLRIEVYIDGAAVDPMAYIDL